MDPENPDTGAITGLVFGFDYCGFSQWVQDQIDNKGDASAEWVSDCLESAFARIGKDLGETGYRQIETLGDGLIAVSEENGDPETQRRRLDEIVSDAGLDLPFRSSVVQGNVQGLPILDNLVLWTGTAIRKCHLAMREAPIQQSCANTPVSVETDRSRLFNAEIVTETVGFVCLRQGKIDRSIEDISAVARFIDATADQNGSRVEKATEDDKGLLFRLHFGSEGDAHHWARSVERNMPSFETEFGIGLARGALYRSVTDGHKTPPVVHGVAVNRAAKLSAVADKIASTSDTPNFTARLQKSPDDPSLTFRESEAVTVLASLQTPGRMVEVVGEAGLGKSHFLTHVAGAHGSKVVRSTGHPRSILEPFTNLRNLLAQVADDSHAKELCGVRTISGEAALLAWGYAICDALTEAAEKNATLFVVDDLQWVDRWSLTGLDRLRKSQGIFLLARRPVKTEFTADLQIRLDPLPDLAVRQLLGSHGDQASLVRLTGGNPFHALQLAAALQEGTELLEGGGNVDAIVDARVRSLTPADRGLIRLIATVGRALPRSALTQLAERSGIELSDATLGRLVDARFLENRTDAYSIVHQLMEQRLIATMPPSLVPALHIDVARTLSALMKTKGEVISFDEIAGHWVSAGAKGRAGVCFGRAGLAALDRGAYSSALTFLNRAEDAASQFDGASSHRSLWAASRAVAAWGHGNVSLCANEADRAFGQLDKVQTRVLSQRGKQRTWSARLRSNVASAEAGHYRGDLSAIFKGNFGAIRWGWRSRDGSGAQARGLAFVATTLGVLRLGSLSKLVSRLALQLDKSSRAASYVHAAQAVVHLGFGRWHRVDQSLSEARSNLERDPEPQLTDVILTLEALRYQMTGDSSRSYGLFVILSERARNRDNDLFDAWGHYGRAMTLLADGSPDLAGDMIGRAQKMFEGLGDLQSELICLGLEAQVMAMLNESDKAIRTSQNAIKLADQLYPSNFGSLEGYSGPMLALAILTAKGSGPDISDLYRIARTNFQKYARVFPIGRPRLIFADCLAFGRPQRIECARTAAIRLGMFGDADNMKPNGIYRREF